MSNHLSKVLAIGAADRADRVFAELPDGTTVSYGEMAARSARFGAMLRALGVKPGDRVAAQVEKSLDALMLYLGTVRAGAVFLPLNTAYTPAEIGYFTGNAEPALLVCDPSRAEALRPIAEGAGARLETMGRDGAAGGSLGALLPADAAGFTDEPRAESDLAAILYTSGTTGRSKGAMLSHGNLASNALVLKDYWRFTDRDVLIHALPVFHTHGLFVATNTLMAAGGSMILFPKFDADAVLAAMPRATAMMGVPTFYTRLLDHPGLTREVVANMRLFVSGSAPLLAETHRAWAERTGHAILERYGMTETNMNTSNPCEGERRAGTVGMPLPGVELRITGPEGEVLPQGEIGGIEVRGPNVFQGYWRMPEKTAEELRPDGWFITGDVGVIDADGYVSIVGRSKDLIISGGFNIYPKEIEAAIDDLPGVLESAVIGLPHADFGEGVAAVVVPEPGAELSEAEIVKALADRLARFKQPKRVLFAPELPRNAMGKVQKAQLRQQHRDLFA